MRLLSYTVFAIMVISGVVWLVFAFSDRKPLKRVLINALITYGCMAVINLSAKYTGVHIPINPYTVAVSGVFGIPAVSMFLLGNFII